MRKCAKYSIIIYSQCPFSVPKDQHRVNTNIIISSDQSDAIHDLSPLPSASQNIHKYKEHLNCKNGRVHNNKRYCKWSGGFREPYNMKSRPTNENRCTRKHFHSFSLLSHTSTHKNVIIIINNIACLSIWLSSKYTMNAQIHCKNSNRKAGNSFSALTPKMT